jgi:transposase
MILRHRVMLVRIQTTIKNRIHVIADLHPDALPRKPEVSDLFGKLGLDWLRRVDLPRPERWRLDELLELLEQLKVRISNSESLIRKIAKQDNRCSLLKTIPGIGDFFSALIVAEVDDIGRFPSAKHFVSYIGLVPRMDKSGSTERGGGLHKQGNAYLRWAFVEAAPHAANSNLSLNDLYDRICARRGKKAGPNIAKCAVARRLAEIAYSVLKEGRPYENR